MEGEVCSINAPEAFIPARTGMINMDALRVPGETISSETGFLRGHGTLVVDGELISTIGGVIEEVDKLKSVRPLKSRYVAQVGDVVVGRVTEIGAKRWKLDINGPVDATLMLSSVNLPDGTQRKRTAEDQLQMRNFFVENDVVCTEVQEVKKDGSVALHTRSEKYGKLMYGTFVKVYPALIKRMPQHFHQLPCGVDTILGNNGYVWISAAALQGGVAAVGGERESMEVDADERRRIREQVARVRNAVTALSQQFALISPASVMSMYEESLHSKIAVRSMVDPRVAPQLVAAAKERQGTGPTT